ncbi:MAG: 23S rRNA (adenine(2503)-C(2))-methyltransferase RlmN [Desulfobacterales bacterium]|nr:23S rRNA (adenine(2503)-C(2))-methyltransferase RlmN [Desulfobacterales bacterium]
MTWERLNILAMTHDALCHELGDRYGRGTYHASAIFKELYVDLNGAVDRTPAVVASRGLSEALRRDLWFEPGTMVQEQCQDGITKFVIRLHDGETVESVVLPMVTHQTVCVSSQVGCRMGCRFCETAKAGLRRNLTADEIVGQVWMARRRYGRHVRNVVFMGMGEPFDNIDNVLQAIRVMNDQRGLDIAQRYITVSTVGLVPGIERLAASKMSHLRLAVSLNASNDLIRSELMPINRVYSMAALHRSLAAYPMKKKQTLMVAYVLIPGLNDRPEHVRELAAYLNPLPVKVNLIPFNPGTGAPFRAPEEEEVKRFCNALVAQRVQVQQRTTKGRDLMAACGQLGSRYASERANGQNRV